MARPKPKGDKRIEAKPSPEAAADAAAETPLTEETGAEGSASDDDQLQGRRQQGTRKDMDAYGTAL